MQGQESHVLRVNFNKASVCTVSADLGWDWEWGLHIAAFGLTLSLSMGHGLLDRSDPSTHVDDSHCGPIQSTVLIGYCDSRDHYFPCFPGPFSTTSKLQDPKRHFRGVVFGIWTWYRDWIFSAFLKCLSLFQQAEAWYPIHMYDETYTTSNSTHLCCDPWGPRSSASNSMTSFMSDAELRSLLSSSLNLSKYVAIQERSLF